MTSLRTGIAWLCATSALVALSACSQTSSADAPASSASTTAAATTVAPTVAARAREAGFIVNPVAPDVLRLAPPLIITGAELTTFVDGLPGLLDAATS